MLVFEAVIHQCIVGDILKIQRLQHVFVPQPGNHIVRGDDHIHGDAAGGKLGVKLFIGSVSDIVYLDIGISLFKFSDNIHGLVTAVGNVLTPVVYIQGHSAVLTLEDQRTNAAHQSGCQSKGTDPLGNTHTLAVSLGTALGFVLLATDLDQVHGDHQHQDQQEQQGEHGVDLGLNGLFRFRVDLDRQGHKVRAGDKVADYEIVQTHGKGHDGAGDHAGHDLMQRHFEESLQRRAAQVHGSILQGRIHLLQLGHDIQNDIGQVKCYMGDQQCPESQTFLLTQQLATDEHEQQGKGDTGHDIRVGHGNVSQTHDRLAQFRLQPVDAHSSHCAEYCGNPAGQHRDQHGVAQKCQ